MQVLCYVKSTYNTNRQVLGHPMNDGGGRTSVQPEVEEPPRGRRARGPIANPITHQLRYRHKNAPCVLGFEAQNDLAMGSILLRFFLIMVILAMTFLNVKPSKH